MGNYKQKILDLIQSVQFQSKSKITEANPIVARTIRASQSQKFIKHHQSSATNKSLPINESHYKPSASHHMIAPTRSTSGNISRLHAPCLTTLLTQSESNGRTKTNVKFHIRDRLGPWGWLTHEAVLPSSQSGQGYAHAFALALCGCSSIP